MINFGSKSINKLKIIVFRKISLHCVLNLCKNKIVIDVPKYLDINQKMKKCCICKKSPDENILIPSQCFTICVLIDGTINLLWKINLTNVLAATKKEIGKLNNIM